jgi:hypothetical protein
MDPLTFEKRMMKTVRLFVLVCVCCAGFFAEAQTRIWRTADGTAFEGVFEKILFDKAYIRSSEGKIQQIPMDQLSPEDCSFIARRMPPEISFDVRKSDRQRPLLEWSIPQDITTLYTFDVVLKKESKGPCDLALTVEFFALGEEVDGDNYVLVRRDKTDFVFPNERKSVFEFKVTDVPFRRYHAHWAVEVERARGVEYFGYVIAVSDPAGNVVASDTNLGSQRWLSENISESVRKLRRIAVEGRGSVFSRHFDESFRKRNVPRIPWHRRTSVF